MKNGTRLVPPKREMTQIERTKTEDVFCFAKYIGGNLFKFNNNALLYYHNKKTCDNPFNLCNPCAIPRF